MPGSIHVIHIRIYRLYNLFVVDKTTGGDTGVSRTTIENGKR